MIEIIGTGQILGPLVVDTPILHQLAHKRLVSASHHFRQIRWMIEPIPVRCKSVNANDTRFIQGLSNFLPHFWAIKVMEMMPGIEDEVLWLWLQLT
jgi:hypothetical protein